MGRLLNSLKFHLQVCYVCVDASHEASLSSLWSELTCCVRAAMADSPRADRLAETIARVRADWNVHLASEACVDELWSHLPLGNGKEPDFSALCRFPDSLSDNVAAQIERDLGERMLSIYRLSRFLTEPILPLPAYRHFTIARDEWIQPPEQRRLSRVDITLSDHREISRDWISEARQRWTAAGLDATEEVLAHLPFDATFDRSFFERFNDFAMGMLADLRSSRAAARPQFCGTQIQLNEVGQDFARRLGLHVVPMTLSVRRDTTSRELAAQTFKLLVYLLNRGGNPASLRDLNREWRNFGQAHDPSSQTVYSAIAKVNERLSHLRIGTKNSRRVGWWLESFLGGSSVAPGSDR